MNDKNEDAKNCIQTFYKIRNSEYTNRFENIVLKNYIQNYDFESSDDEAELKADRYQTVYDTLDDDLLEFRERSSSKGVDTNDATTEI